MVSDNADKWYIIRVIWMCRTGQDTLNSKKKKKKTSPFLDIFDFLSLTFASRGYFLHRFGGPVLQRRTDGVYKIALFGNYTPSTWLWFIAKSSRNQCSPFSRRRVFLFGWHSTVWEVFLLRI